MSSCHAKLACLCAGLALILGANAAVAQEESPRGDGPDWIPSVGAGFAIYSREYNATITGVRTLTFADPAFGTLITVPRGFVSTRTYDPSNPVRGTSGLGNPRQCTLDPPGGGFNPTCGPFEDDNTDALDGGAATINAQLLGPSWGEGFLSVRPLLHGGFAWPLDSRTLAQDGLKPGEFQSPGALLQPRVRLEVNADPKGYWWIGAGGAFRLPIERYNVRTKLSLGYMQETVDSTASATMFQTSEAGTQCTRSTSASETLTIHSIMPSIGLEADLARFGPIMLTLSADTYFSVALNDASTGFGSGVVGSGDVIDPAFRGRRPAFDSPRTPPTCNDPPDVGRGTGQVVATIEPDDLHIFGGIQLRFGWVGFGR